MALGLRCTDTHNQYGFSSREESDTELERGQVFDDTQSLPLESM